MTQKLDEIDAELREVRTSLDDVFSKVQQSEEKAASSAPVVSEEEQPEEKSEERQIEEIRQAVGAPPAQPQQPQAEVPNISMLNELKKQIQEQVSEEKNELEQLKGELSELEKAAMSEKEKEKEAVQTLLKQVEELKHANAVNVEEEIKFVETSLLQTIDHLTTQADKINQLITEMNAIKTSFATVSYNSTKHLDDIVETMKLLERNVQYIYTCMQQSGQQQPQNPNVR